MRVCMSCIHFRKIFVLLSCEHVRSGSLLYEIISIIKGFCSSYWCWYLDYAKITWQFSTLSQSCEISFVFCFGFSISLVVKTSFALGDYFKAQDHI